MVYGFSPYGALGSVVRVEVDLRRGLPGTDIVGLPNSEVREARERVRAAVRNSGFEYPLQRVLINLAPGEIPKAGSGFDLAIALAILQESGQIELPGDLLAVGELSIRGVLIPARGTLSAVLAAGEVGIAHAIVPSRASSMLAGSDLASVVLACETLAQMRRPGPKRLPPECARMDTRGGESFDDIRGQPQLKWGCAVAVAGFHNLLLLGPPGSGKTMAARRLATLHPPFPVEDARTLARIYSLRGLERVRPIDSPPLRMPHHSSSLEGLLGGGRTLSPGEASLAHRGILVLDEAAEFRPRVLQSLREPVEQHTISLSRAGRLETFPASFQLVLTSNLCPCGRLGRSGARCLCSMREIDRYWRRIGEALLDRVPIRIRTFYRQPDQDELSAESLRERIDCAVRRQRERTVDGRWYRNARVPPAHAARLLALPPEVEHLLHRELASAGLSDRAAHNVRAVARTIADMADRESVSSDDVAEAIAFHIPGTLDLH